MAVLDLIDHLRRILDLLEDSRPEELGRDVRSRLDAIHEPGFSPERTSIAVRNWIDTNKRIIQTLTAELDHIESNRSALADEILPDGEARNRVREMLRQISRITTNRSLVEQTWGRGVLSGVSTRIRTLEIDGQELTSAVDALRDAVPLWAESYQAAHGRFNKLELYIALKRGFAESAQRKQREANLEEIKSVGVEPYPHRFDRTHTISQAVETYAQKTGEQLEALRPQTRVAGRIHAINKMGKAAFVRITDGIEMIQVYLRSNELDERTWQLFKLLDLGDHVGAEGRVFRTRTGELSIHCESLTFLAKALLPPPDKYYGLHDIELRYRQRYADLIANRAVRRVFETRSQVIRLIRAFFDERGYVEVETPMLTPLPTGAAARPFVTHHNALDIDLYARIAPELYLKRLIVGGFERVYEINRNFRNEGLSTRHNPEFTMLEWYQAYSDFEDLIELTETMISQLVERVYGTAEVEYDGQQIDFARPWARMTMREAIVHYWNHPTASVGAGEPGTVAAQRPAPDDLTTTEDLLQWIERSDHPNLKSQVSKLQSEVSNGGTLSYGYLLGAMFEHVAEPHLVNPTFITEFPIELSPLSKQNERDPAFVDRFELFIAGMEIANGFCEINDPADQRRRFEDQMRLRERGDEEAMLIDEDYLRALSYGMPPTAGEGVGIDRLVMILTNSKSIRDVILFPHMRPESTKG